MGWSLIGMEGERVATCGLEDVQYTELAMFQDVRIGTTLPSCKNEGRNGRSNGEDCV